MSFLSRWFRSANTASRKVHAPQAKLGVETLESRVVPTVSTRSGVLYITGNDAPNTVVVANTVQSNGYFALKITEDGINRVIDWSYVYTHQIVFTGAGGNDYFRNNTDFWSYAYGQNGDDTLIGGSQYDYLDGGNGSDSLYGMGGDDTLIAGYDYSYNYLAGGSGNDSMYGGYGPDAMWGESGNDYLAGNAGNDYLNGGTGIDGLYGEAGDDTLDGGLYDGVADYLVGGSGRDRFRGSYHDTLADYSAYWGDSVYY